MKRVFGLFVGLLIATGAQAQGPYLIKLKPIQIGDVRQLDTAETTQSTSKIIDKTNKALVDKTDSSVQHCVCTESVLAKESGRRRPTHAQRQYSKVSFQVDGREVTLPYAGKMVEVKKVGSGYQFLLEGQTPLTGEAAWLLTKEFSNEEGIDFQAAILPKQPVKVYESWQIDMAPIVADWSKNKPMQVDGAKSAGLGQLMKVYEKEGRLFGELQFQIEMPFASIGQGQEKVPVQAGSRVRMDITLDVCIDGSSSTGTMTAKYDVSTAADVPMQDGSKAKLVIATQGTLQHGCVEMKK